MGQKCFKADEVQIKPILRDQANFQDHAEYLEKEERSRHKHKDVWTDQPTTAQGSSNCPPKESYYISPSLEESVRIGEMKCMPLQFRGSSHEAPEVHEAGPDILENKKMSLQEACLLYLPSLGNILDKILKIFYNAICKQQF